MKALALATVSLLAAGCDCAPKREDFVLAPEIVDPSGSCAGTPEALTLAFAVRWANGEHADPADVVVDPSVDVFDPATDLIVGPRIRHDPEETFDGQLDPGETVVIHYGAQLDAPSFGCAAVCAGEVVLQLRYGIDFEGRPTPPVPDMEIRSGVFTFDCG